MYDGSSRSCFPGATVLTAVIADLGGVAEPSERDFLALGDALGRAGGVLAAVEGDFAALTRRLRDDESSAALGEALARIAGLSGSGGAAAQLAGLGEATRAAAGRLAALHAVVGEVGGLAMNAKIQAAQMGAGADFAVFTGEIARLGDLAAGTLTQALAGLAGLRASVAGAHQAELAFVRGAETELHQARERIEACLALMQDRRLAAAAAAGGLADRSRRIAAAIGERIGELQINDMTCQRVEHVRAALAVLAGLDDGPPAALGTICRLQAAQLAHAADEFEHAMAGFSHGIGGLADEARAMMAEAGGLLGQGEGPDSSFLRRMEDDVATVSALLADFAATRAKVDDVIAAVAEALAALSRDLAAIRSIDADLRIMALNATLKCGRLGPAGRALAVIAQELRGCSKRSEDGSKAVAAAIDRTVALAGTLGHGPGPGAVPAGQMDRLMAGLTELDAATGAGLAGLGERCRDAALLLGQAGEAVRGHMVAVLRDAAGRLEELAAAAGEPADSAGLRADLGRLLSRQYTMSSERVIHQLFAEDSGEAAAAEASAASSVDDLLF